MNSYPDPTQETPEFLLVGETEYREYSSASSLQPGSSPYLAAPSFRPGYMPVANTPVPPMQVPPYPYGPTRQTFQSQPRQLMSSSPTAKTSSRGWIILLSSIGIAILVLGAVLIYAISQASLPHSTFTNATTTPSNRTISQPGVVNLRQSITINGLTATLLSVEPLQGDGKINPDAGNKFLIVQAQLHNEQNIAQLYNSFDFHVFNGDNQERGVEDIVPATYTADLQLFEDDLAPNDTIIGDLIIQVPVDDHKVKLGWNPGSVTSDSAYEWNLGL